MSNKAMRPAFLAELDAERSFAEAHQKSRLARRVKIEKKNQAWLVRFLPVELGIKKLWYIRNGQHWFNRSPIACPRLIPAEFGGDPKSDCPVCRVSDALNAESNEEISSMGYELRASVTYLTYCLVYEIDLGQGRPDVKPLSEILKPWEFSHYPSSFDELSTFVKRGYSEARPWSVLDLDAGNDFWATKTTKGIRLDRQDPGSILEQDANYEKNLDEIFAQVHQPKITLPTQQQLEVFARKAEASAYGDGGDTRSGRSAGGRGRFEETDEAEEDRPSRRSGRGSARTAEAPAEPGRRSARSAAPVEPEPPEEPAAGEEPQNADDPQQDDQVPGAEVAPPSPRRAAPAAAAARPAARQAAPAAVAPAARRAPQPAAVEEPPEEPVAEEPAAEAQDEVPPPAPRRAAPAAATASARPAARPAAAATAARPAAASARPAARPAAAPAESSVHEEEDNVAEERVDHAPPAEEPAAEPPVGAAAAPRAGLRSKLLARVQNATK